MPNFNPQYLYPDGTALSASGHTGNLAAATPEQGIYTLYNGSLDTNNINISSITSDFIMLSENVAFGKYSWRSPKIVYDNGIGGAADGDPTPCGIGVRFYLPCNVKALRLDFSIFASACRARRFKRSDMTGNDKFQWSETNALELYMQPFLDGVALGGRKIVFPKCMAAGTTTTGGAGANNHITSLEHRVAQQYRNSYVQALSGNAQLAAGIHTFEIRVRIESPGQGGFLLEGDQGLGNRLGAFTKAEQFSSAIHQRLTFGSGCITMRAIGLKSP